MIIEKGEKIHVINRRLFPEAVQRHFAGEVIVADLRYGTIDRSFLVITDGKKYQLDIHEFGPRR